MRKVLAAAAAGATLTVCNMVIQITPAEAAPCTPTAGYIEGWDGTNTCATFLWSYVWNIINVGGCKNVGAPNATSYIWNNTAEQWRAWTGSGCTGSSAPLYAHTAGPMTGIWNNNIESFSRDN